MHGNIEDRENVALAPNEQLTMQALLAVGTSAGGRQMKAIVALNNKSGEIRSGQIDGLEGFDYYIIKFGDNSLPISEIEAAYSEMAKDAGIVMEECRLLQVEGINHFLTKRFDRKDGKKIHIQTLAAINPEACCYEDIIATCRALNLSENEIKQVYRRMVFNVMTNNTDDHNKNMSFMLEEGGHWQLAPAYDITFIFNSSATGPNSEHRMSIGGKTSEISKTDLLEFAKQNEIHNATQIINEIAQALNRFSEYADHYHISQPWKGIIQKTISDTLSSYGYATSYQNDKISFVDNFGRLISDVQVKINTKGHYEISAIINDKRNRKFISKTMDVYDNLESLDIFRIPVTKLQKLIEAIFPPT